MKTAELWRQEAQAGLEKVAVDHKALSSDGSSDRLTEYWNSLSSETKNTLINSIIGGALGGGSMGAMGALSAPSGEGLHKGINSGIMGALLGAITGGAGTAAYNAVSSGRQLPGEVKGRRPVGDTLADTVVGGMARNPALTAGTGAGLWVGGKGAHELLRNLRRFNEVMAKTKPADRTRRARFRAGLELMGGNAVRSLALPAGIGLGYLADRYIKGDYE